MNKLLYFIILFLGFFSYSFGQDFKFTWNVDPSFHFNYSVEINRLDSKSYITITKYRTKLINNKRLKNKDCDALLLFLANYRFQKPEPKVDSSLFYRLYLETTLLPDTSLVLIKGNLYRKSLMRLNGMEDYYYDEDKKSYYFLCKPKYTGSCTDGDEYFGEYNCGTLSKRFYFHCEVAQDDYDLNKMILDFVLKYDKKNDYKELIDIVTQDKPRN